jgi:hypothetical protein
MEIYIFGSRDFRWFPHVKSFILQVTELFCSMQVEDDSFGFDFTPLHVQYVLEQVS